MSENTKKPFYKKTWFIIIIVLVALGIVGGAMGVNDKDEPVDKKEKYNDLSFEVNEDWTKKTEDEGVYYKASNEAESDEILMKRYKESWESNSVNSINKFLSNNKKAVLHPKITTYNNITGLSYSYTKDKEIHGFIFYSGKYFYDIEFISSKKSDEMKTFFNSLEFITDVKFKSKNENLALGESYDDDGIIVTLNDISKKSDSVDISVTFENTRDEDYTTSMSHFRVYSSAGQVGTLIPTSNDEFFNGGTIIKPGKKINEVISVAPISDIKMIAYSQNGNWSIATSVWLTSVLPKAEEKPIESRPLTEEEKKEQEAKDKVRKEEEELASNASIAAREEAASLMPTKKKVTWPVLFYQQSKKDDGYYEVGSVKYKDKDNNELKVEYKLWYDDEGKLTKFELNNEKMSLKKKWFS